MGSQWIYPFVSALILSSLLLFKKVYRDTDELVSGLYGGRNSCFANSTLQLIFSVPEFFDSKARENSDKNCSAYKDLFKVRSDYISGKLGKVALNSDGSELVNAAYNLEKLVEALGIKNFYNGRQEDAHEFFVEIYRAIRNCLGDNRLDNISNPRLVSIRITKLSDSSKESVLVSEKNYSADFLSVQLNKLRDSSLNRTKNFLELWKQLDKAGETDNYSIFSVTRFASFPKYFFVYLERFTLDSFGRITKQDEPIELLEFIPAADLLFENDAIKNREIIGNSEYHLIGVVMHSGSLEYGHYIAFVKRDEDWYLCDDQLVQKVENFSSRVHEKRNFGFTVYLLLYKFHGDDSLLGRTFHEKVENIEELPDIRKELEDLLNDLENKNNKKRGRGEESDLPRKRRRKML